MSTRTQRSYLLYVTSLSPLLISLSLSLSLALSLSHSLSHSHYFLKYSKIIW
jgi:hypothetical protein